MDMIYILLFGILILLVFEVYIRKNLVAPSILLLLSFLLATVLIFVNRKEWDVVIYPIFLEYVFTAILFFILGGSFFRIISKQNFDKNRNYSIIEDRLRLQSKPSGLIFLISTLCTLAYIYITLRGIGFSTNFTFMLSQIYKRSVENNGSNTFIANQLVKIVVAITNVIVFQFFLEKYVVKRGYSLYSYLIFLLPLGIVLIFSTDRNIFVRFLIYTFVLWVLFYMNTTLEKRINFQVVKRAIIMAIVAMGLFYLLGILKNYTSNFQRVLGIYGGSGLYNFNLFISEFDFNQLLNGEKTFSAIQGIFSSLGLLDMDVNKTVFDVPITFRSSTGFVYISNIYSALRPYVEDFGLYGAIVIPFFVGMIYEFMFYLVLKSRFNFTWVLYALLIYPIIYFAIDEQFFKRLHLGTLYEIFWVIVFYYCSKRYIRLKFVR